MVGRTVPHQKASVKKSQFFYPQIAEISERMDSILRPALLSPGMPRDFPRKRESLLLV
jgi:hypothetical protein